MIEPTEEARKLALDGWVDVKYLLRKNRENPYYVLAEKNIDLLISQAKNDVHE
jgi:hypothetical protein